MSYANIDREWLKNKPKFWLCLPYPRRTGMRKLTEIYNVDVKFILGRVNELSFDIPTKVERNHELVPNELIKLFEGYYQVKMEWNGQTEYFVYVKGNRKLDNSGKNLSYKLYSTSYLIGKKSIPIYEETSKNLKFHAQHFLVDTNWKIGHIDSEFNTIYREITASQSNSLQCLYDLCEKFEAVMTFDTVDQIVNFYKPENIGINKGMVFKDGVTLESLGQEIDYDKIITRLHVYGSDGLEFRRLSAVGVNYLQNLDWFIRPFTQDTKGNVIRSSKWLTDEFCIAYLKYQKLLAEQQPIFESLVLNKTGKQDDITQLESQISEWEFRMNQLLNEIWVINKTYGEDASHREDWGLAWAEYEELQRRVARTGRLIDAMLQEENDFDTRIANIRNLLKLENNFTPSQIIEMKEFIHTGYYTNDAITDDEDLMKDGQVAFKKVNQPPITINLSIVNFFNDIQFEKLKDRIVLGDTVRVKSEDLDVYVSLKIIEIAYNLENDNITLTISNEKDLRDDMAKLVDAIYSSSHASNTLEANKGNWNKGGLAFEEVNKVMTNPWDASKNYVIGGYENTTVINKNGLVSIDSPDNPNTYLFINNGILGITTDNLKTLNVAIDKDGIRAKLLQGDIILGNDLRLTSEDGLLEADGEGIKIKDENGNIKVELGKYTDPNTGLDVHGLYINGGAFNLRTSTDSNRGTVIDGDGIRVYDSSGNIVFNTADGDNMEYSGQVNLNGSVVTGSLIFRENNNIGEARIYYSNGGLHFDSDVRHVFYGDVFIQNKNLTNANLYINGIKITTY